MCMAKTPWVNGIKASVFPDRPSAICYPRQERQLVNKPQPWTESDEMRWKLGSVHCPFVLSEIIKINNPPPSFCPYILEHFFS